MPTGQRTRLGRRSLSGNGGFVGVELRTAAGAAVGAAYNCRYTPSYLVFDEHGDLVRTIIPDNVTPIANGYRVLDETGAVVSRAPRVTPELLVDLVRFTG